MALTLPARRRTNAMRKQHLAAYLLIAPFFIVFILMLILPLGYSGYLSLFRSQIVGGTTFVGISNYIQAILDPQFQSGVARMALFLVVQVPVMLGLALVIALALDSNRVHFGRFVRLAVFVPYAVPSVVATLMWGYLYGTDFGPIDQLLKAVGIGSPNLLSSANITGSIMNIVTWEYVGYNMIILYAAMRAIPQELYDAAQVDGASQLRIAWSVKIPSIRPALVLTIMFSIIGTFQLFNEPNLLYVIAPGAVGTSFSPNVYAYNLAFVEQNLNYSAAIAFLLGLVVAIVSFFVQTGLSRQGEITE